VEVAVMVFREDLEGGSLPRSSIDAKVAEYRAKLIAESDSAAAEADRKASLARCTAGCLVVRVGTGSFRGSPSALWVVWFNTTAGLFGGWRTLLTAANAELPD